jgi:hypothetical protein
MALHVAPPPLYEVSLIYVNEKRILNNSVNEADKNSEPKKLNVFFSKRWNLFQNETLIKLIRSGDIGTCW